jgi:hypothetical protein
MCVCIKISGTRITYLYAVGNVYNLSKRAVTEVLEDRRGSARNKLKRSTDLGVVAIADLEKGRNGMYVVCRSERE